MFKLFAVKIPKLRIRFEFTNFAVAMLIFTELAVAAINVSSSGNVEIAAFIENESKKNLQVTDTLVLNVNFQTAKDEHSRAGILFFIGERKVSIKADYNLDLPAGQLKGTVQADTSWFTGYCGMIECQNKPLPAQQRIETLKVLVSRLLTELNNRLQAAFVEKEPEQN